METDFRSSSNFRPRSRITTGSGTASQTHHVSEFSEAKLMGQLEKLLPRKLPLEAQKSNLLPNEESQHAHHGIYRTAVLRNRFELKDRRQRKIGPVDEVAKHRHELRMPIHCRHCKPNGLE